MQSAVLLGKEVSDLRAENEKKKQKRTRSTRTIVHEGDLSVQDVRELRYREQVSEGLKPPP